MATIVNTMIQGLTEQMIQARLNTADASKFLFGVHFPVKKVNGFKWKTLQNQLEKKNVAADLHTDNGTILRKRRPIFETAMGDIPFISISRDLTRAEIKEYQTALAFAQDEDATKLVQYWGEDVDFCKSTESDIIIYTKPKDNKKPGDGYVIYDSKGLCNLSDDPIYMFAKRKGYIQGDTLTDQQISKKYSEASTAIISLSLKFYTYLTENVTIANWNWETSDYSYSASGRGVVKNNTQYTIPNVKYVVTYLKGNGTEVTQDDGYVTYDEIRPYGMKSFSFYTSYVGDASRAKIRLEFDNDFILKTVADGEFE